LFRFHGSEFKRYIKVSIYFKKTNISVFCIRRRKDFCFVKTDKKLRSFLRKLGRRIRDLRKAQQISQSQLAFESGLQRVTIGAIERGEQNPTAETLYNIAKALDVNVREFFDFEH
jgi:DNA-binding XRE family transcriptional regulator